MSWINYSSPRFQRRAGSARRTDVVAFPEPRSRQQTNAVGLPRAGSGGSQCACQPEKPRSYARVSTHERVLSRLRRRCRMQNRGLSRGRRRCSRRLPIESDVPARTSALLFLRFETVARDAEEMCFLFFLSLRTRRVFSGRCDAHARVRKRLILLFFVLFKSFTHRLLRSGRVS